MNIKNPLVPTGTWFTGPNLMDSLKERGTTRSELRI